MITHRPTIFIVDDNTATKHALTRLFDSLQLNTKSFSSAEDFLQYYSVHMTGCLITDVHIPTMGGLKLQQALHMHLHSLPIIFLSAHCDIHTAVEIMHGGAFYLLEKPFSEKTLLHHAQCALEQDQHYHPKRVEFIAVQARISNLTERELEVLHLVVNNHSNKSIAEQLGVSIKTVEFHRSHMMEKMHAKSLLELVELTREVIPFMKKSACQSY